jgi:hypothetical protein
LEALARGDADAALSYSSDQPASKEFLTDDILKKQTGKWPITDIRILDDTATASMGTVHVAVKFGDQISDETLFLEQKNGECRAAPRPGSRPFSCPAQRTWPAAHPRS